MYNKLAAPYITNWQHNRDGLPYNISSSERVNWRTRLQQPAKIYTRAGEGPNRKGTTKCLQVKGAGELNREATEIVEKQHCRLKDSRLNLTTPLTSEAEASEPEIYGGARTKTTSRAKLNSAAPGALPQEAMAPMYNSSHSELRQAKPLEKHAALLRDEIFNVIPGMVNTQCGAASKNRKTRSGSKLSDDEIFYLPQVPDTPLAGSGHGPRVTFRSPVVRPGSVPFTPHLVPQPVSFNLSRISNTETSGKDTDSEAEVGPKTGTRSSLTLYPKGRRMRNDASITSHSLQPAAEEFRKICKSKIQKLKGRYLANAMLLFNSWLKDIEICVSEWKLTNMEVVQLMKDYVMEGAWGAIEFYLDTNSMWDYRELIEHPRTSFESGKTFSFVAREFYSCIQWPWKTEDQFANELLILDWKVISVRPCGKIKWMRH